MAQPRQPLIVVASIKVAYAKIERFAEMPPQPPQMVGEVIVRFFDWQGDQALSLSIGEQLFQAQDALAFFCPSLAVGQQLRQSPIGSTVLGEAEQAGCIGEVQPCADEKAKGRK